MDRIDPIGPHERDIPRVEPVVSRITPEEREQELRELELPAEPDQDDDGHPHIDVRV